MDYGFLCVRTGGIVADSGTCPVAGVGRFSPMCNIAKPIFPSPPYLVFAVIVGLKVVHYKVIADRETPDFTNPWAIRIEVIDFINTPVVSRFQFKNSGIIAL